MLHYQAQHNLMLQEDENRAKDVELKARAYSVQCETRIAELESKLSELSETVGNYERLRFQDQQNIQVNMDIMVILLKNTFVHVLMPKDT